MSNYSGVVGQDRDGRWFFEIFRADGRTVQLKEGYASESEAQAALQFHLHELRVRDQQHQ